MNDRMKELILEAGFPKFDKMYVVSDGEELEKFAELIVRECMNVLDPGQNQVIARFQARQWLAEHFGVDS
jgi:hypothetical protein